MQARPRPRARTRPARSSRRRSWPCSRSSSGSSRRVIRSIDRPGWAATVEPSRSTSCARWSAVPSSPAPGSRFSRAMTGSPGSGHGCAATRSMSCRTCGSRPRRDVDRRPAAHGSGPGRAVPERQRGRLDVKPGITGWAQINGRAAATLVRADRARPLVRRASVVCARSEDPGAHGRDGRERTRPLQGRNRRMAPPGIDIGVLLTGVGKRYDIVSAFAQHATVVAADPNPLARRSTRPTTGSRCPNRRCRVCAGAPGAMREAQRRGRGAADRSRHRGARACARRRPATGVHSGPRDRPGNVRQVRGPPAARASRPAVAADGAAQESPPLLPGDGRAPPGVGRPVDPPGRRRARRQSSSSTTSRSRRWCNG